MAAPLPPTFTSFPDLEPGPSTEKRDTRESKKRDKGQKSGDHRTKKSERSRTDRPTDNNAAKRKIQKHQDDSYRYYPSDHPQENRSAADRRRDGVAVVNAQPQPREPRIDNKVWVDELKIGLGNSEEQDLLFYSDRRGDPLNVSYGGLYARSIPKYNLAGWGKKILGLDSSWSVVYRGANGVEIGQGSRRKVPQLTDRSTHILLTTGKTRRLLVHSGSSRYEEIDGFLPLPRRQRRLDEQAYRSISAGNAISDSDSSDSDPESSPSSGDDSDTSPLDARQEAVRSLEQQLTANPSSVSNWLSLLDHSLSNVPPTSKNATQARAEITLSILSRALAASRVNEKSAYLWLKLLKAGEEIWSEIKLKAEWEHALDVSGDPDLWLEWLDWRVRKATVGVNGIVDDAIHVYEHVGLGLVAEAAEIARLRVMWRVAVFLRDAGYPERATAMFQAQAELTFKTPKAAFALPIEARLDMLEEFWESEVPRLGEHGARGWQAWNSDSESPAQVFRPEGQDIPSAATSDPYSTWASKESAEDRNLCLPQKSPNDNADPYATILFSDIKTLLLNLTMDKAKDKFRYIWLSFLGLHIPGFSASLSSLAGDDKWASTHLTSPSFFAALFPPNTPKILADSYSGVLIGREKEYRPTFGAVKEWGMNVLGPVEGVGLDGAARMWEEFHGDVEFVRRVFQQLRIGQQDVAWDLLTLAFECSVNTKSALKASRTLLSGARQSATLWAMHARLERIRGRHEEARKIYVTLISSSDHEWLALAPVWWDFAELEWLMGRNDAALEVIMRASGQPGEVEGINILRAKRQLEDYSRTEQESLWKDRLCWIKLRILLEFLTGTVQGAISVAEGFILNEEEGDVAHESLTVAFLLLLFHHSVTLRNPCPPATLRGKVQKALEVFPSNTIIIGLFLECEKGEGVWGRVRSLLGDAGEGRVNEKSVSRRVAEVWIAGWEKARWQSELNRVRAGLNAAVVSDRTRGSPVLWRVYVEFEINMAQLQNAKRVLFRALGECPMVKEFYLLAFGPLRSVFKVSELNTLAETMAERGLRVRTALDEAVEGWLGEEGESEEDNGAEGELERDAEELRRLMPY